MITFSLKKITITFVMLMSMAASINSMHLVKPPRSKRPAGEPQKKLHKKARKAVLDEFILSEFSDIESLIKQGFNINELFYLSSSNTRTAVTPAMLTAFNGSSDILKKLVDLGADLSIENEGGSSALWYAVSNDNLNATLIILGKMGLNFTDSIGRTATHMAAEISAMQILKYMIDNDANLEAEDNKHQNPLIIAAQNDNINPLKILVKNLGVNKVNSQGLTPAMSAAAFGKLQNWKFLIKKGADLTMRDNQGNNAMIHAVCCNHINIVAYTLATDAGFKHGIDDGDNNGCTPLMISVNNSYLDMFRLLVENKADVLKKDLLGRNIADYAKHNIDILTLVEHFLADYMANKSLNIVINYYSIITPIYGDLSDIILDYLPETSMSSTFRNLAKNNIRKNIDQFSSEVRH